MISDDRIMGFVEGEGCFSITIGKYIDRRSRKGRGRSNIKKPHLFKVTSTFRLTIADGDRQILEEIKETLGIGQIYVQKRTLKYKNQQNVAYYYVESHKDCQKIMEFFQRQRFYTRKGKDFQLWCKGLEIILSSKHLKKEGLLELCRIRDQMNYRKTKSKWSAEEIEKILDAKPIHQTAHFDEKQEKLIHNSEFDLKAWLSPKQGNHKKARSILDIAQTQEKAPNSGN